jgi:hypothetical protein
LADCDFNQAALRPANPIKCHVSTYRHACEVELDRETRDTSVVAYTAVDDSGVCNAGA